MIEQVAVRPLRAGDVGALDGVLTRAYGRSFARRLASYLEMESLGTFVAEYDGNPVGMVIGTDYGPLAYVGQMAVDPPFQRRGIASALMTRLIAWVDRRGFAAAELDATPAGEPLYARFGFVAAGRTDVYERRPAGVRSSVGARAYAAADRAEILALDACAFGADRSEVIGALLDEAAESVVVADGGERGGIAGYAVAQPNDRRLGPVIATDTRMASELIAAAGVHLRSGHVVGVPSGNPAVAALMADHGYHLVRSLSHMIRATVAPRGRPHVFARINLGQG